MEERARASPTTKMARKDNLDRRDSSCICGVARTGNDDWVWHIERRPLVTGKGSAMAPSCRVGHARSGTFDTNEPSGDRGSVVLRAARRGGRLQPAAGSRSASTTAPAHHHRSAPSTPAPAHADTKPSSRCSDHALTGGGPGASLRSVARGTCGRTIGTTSWWRRRSSPAAHPPTACSSPPSNPTIIASTSAIPIRTYPRTVKWM